jgi:alpha-mannosidase
MAFWFGIHISTCNEYPDHAILSTVCRVRTSQFPPHQAELETTNYIKRVPRKSLHGGEIQ